MKKLLTLCSLLILVSGYCVAAPSYTNVTVTLQDTSTQVWRNATWRTQFQQPFGNPNRPSNGGTNILAAQTGVANSSGVFTVTLDDNLVVTPSGSHTMFTICPNATVATCTSIIVVVTGISQNLSSTINPQLIIPVVNAVPTIYRAYTDLEANGGLGTLYVSTTDNTLRICQLAFCNGTGWSPTSVTVNNPIFTGLLTTDNLQVNNNANIDGNLNVNGTSTFNGISTFNDAVTINSTLHVTGISTFDNTIEAKNCIDYVVTIIDFTHVCPQAGGPFNILLPAGSGTLARLTDIVYPVTSVFGLTGAVLSTIAANTVIGNNTGGAIAPSAVKVNFSMTDGTTIAPIASPTFTGDPKAPTPSVGDNDTSIATTAFVKTAITSQTITPFHFTSCTTDSSATPGTCGVSTQALPATQPDTNYEIVCSFDAGDPAVGGTCSNDNGGNPCIVSVSTFNKKTTTFGYALVVNRDGIGGGGDVGVVSCMIGHS